MHWTFWRAILFSDPLIIVTTIFMGTISLLSSLFDRDGHAQHSVARAWARMLLKISAVKVQAEGLEKLDPKGSYVLASNHLSLMDTPVMLAYIPGQFRFLAKQGLFRIPFLGTHLRRAGHLAVVRDDPRAGLRSMSTAARIIQQRKISVTIFPEGRRACDSQLQEFKEGAAYIAIKAGVPLVPVGIMGTREVLPMGSIHIRGGHVRLRIGDPIPTAGLHSKDRGRLTQILRERVAELVGEPAPQPLCQ